MRLRTVCRSTRDRPFFVFPQMCLKPRKSKVSGLPRPRALSVRRRVASELEESRLFRVQLQLEFLHSFTQFRPEPFGLVFELESNHDVGGVAQHDYVALRPLPSPCLNPQIKDVMKVDVRQQWRCTSALRRACTYVRAASSCRSCADIFDCTT
jgi:hypothetical protein